LEEAQANNLTNFAGHVLQSSAAQPASLLNLFDKFYLNASRTVKRVRGRGNVWRLLYIPEKQTTTETWSQQRNMFWITEIRML